MQTCRNTLFLQPVPQKFQISKSKIKLSTEKEHGHAEERSKTKSWHLTKNANHDAESETAFSKQILHLASWWAKQIKNNNRNQVEKQNLVSAMRYILQEIPQCLMLTRLVGECILGENVGSGSSSSASTRWLRVRNNSYSKMYDVTEPDVTPCVQTPHTDVFGSHHLLQVCSKLACKCCCTSLHISYTHSAHGKQERQTPNMREYKTRVRKDQARSFGKEIMQGPVSLIRSTSPSLKMRCLGPWFVRPRRMPPIGRQNRSALAAAPPWLVTNQWVAQRMLTAQSLGKRGPSWQESTRLDQDVQVRTRRGISPHWILIRNDKTQPSCQVK